jgi:hypothetical protein
MQKGFLMKKRTIYLLVILALGIIISSISIVQVVNGSDKFAGSTPTQNDPPTADSQQGSVLDPTDHAGKPTPTECDHILSGKWISSDSKHYRRCTVKGCDFVTEAEDCYGGTATCSSQAICTVCQAPYGEIAEHIWSDSFEYSEKSGHAHICLFEDCLKHSDIIPHTPGNEATESSPQICTDCGFVITPTLDHTHVLTHVDAVSPSCTAKGNIEYYICGGCSSIFEDKDARNEIEDISSVQIAARGHNLSDATCTSARKCKNCDYTDGKALGHSPRSEYSTDKNAHWHICSVCNEKLDHEKHRSSGEATETTAEICTVCKYVIKAALGHTHKYSTEIKYDSENHWRECSCKSKKDIGAHLDDNNDEKCDICSYPMPKSDTSPAPKPPETTTDPSDKTPQEGDRLEGILKPAQITLLRPVASGVLTKSNASAIIDYSNFKDGYVMIKFVVEIDVRLKVQIQGPTTTYTYDIKPFEWTVFPLSDGNGKYSFKVLKNLSGTRYVTVLSLSSVDVELEDEFAPFLRPNQYVNYENAINTMNKGAELVGSKTDTLEKVEAIYTYVVKTLKYDYNKAATVQSGYLPDLDQVLAEKKGICFDYAALMAGMLRSQGIACKLIVGYADEGYHAWINVWTSDKGWVDGVILFDGIEWKLMDPTFVSVGGNSAMNGVVYTAKYVY